MDRRFCSSQRILDDWAARMRGVFFVLLVGPRRTRSRTSRDRRGPGDNFGFTASGAGDFTGTAATTCSWARYRTTRAAPTPRAYIYDVESLSPASPHRGRPGTSARSRRSHGSARSPRTSGSRPTAARTYELLEEPASRSASNAGRASRSAQPTKFAMVRVKPAGSAWGRPDQSDSLFTIQTSVSLLSMLAARLPEGGAAISWESDPGPATSRAIGWRSGPRLERMAHDRSAHARDLGRRSRRGRRRPLPPLRRERFGEELWLGETSLPPRARWRRGRFPIAEGR